MPTIPRVIRHLVGTTKIFKFFPKCSLMGGVQLFAMIKMLGLQRSDLNPRFDNGAAWCGYQVRIMLEMVLTLYKSANN